MLLLVLLSYLPAPAEHKSCDLIELNHYYDGDGNLILDQWIFWDWEFNRHVVADWCIASTSKPYMRQLEGGWELSVLRSGRRIRIHSYDYRETWSAIDPEVKDRKFLPARHRRGVFK